MNITIIGAGDVGLQLAKKLSNEKHNIVIIDHDPQRVLRARDQADALVIEGNGVSMNVLREAQFEKSDIFAALTTSDEVNLIAAQMAKKVGVPKTIARVRSSEYRAKDFILNDSSLWPDYVIQPEIQTAKAIARLVRQSNATDIIEFDEGKIQLIGVRLEDKCSVLYTPLMELGQKENIPPFTIVAINRKQFTIIPNGTDQLMPGDQVFIISKPEYIQSALEFFGKSDHPIENIMIVGGGIVGGYLADELEDEVNVKIIEKDEAKSLELADKVQNSLVINGDGSDLDLLTFEGLMDMDVFITVTQDDESNIISSLLARHLEVPRTITLVDRIEYSSLAPSIGLDSVVNKQLITVNSIQKFIRMQDMAFYAELPGVDAEIIEFIAKEKSKITRKQLMNLKFPKGSIVGAIINEHSEMIVPTGTSQISPGDKVIVFCLPKARKDVEKMF